MFGFLVFVIAGVAATCTPNATHGCLDSTPYSYSEQFPCGSHGIFDYKDHLCCEQGRPFSSQNEYCCTGSGQKGVHDYTAGKCDLHGTDSCACYDTLAQPKVVLNEDSLIDTASPPEGGYQCNAAHFDQGCLNGYSYNYSTHTPCGPWLMEYGKYGCCPSSAGFLPYTIGSFYCCKIEGAPPGKDYQVSKSPCKCHRYGCS